MTIAPIIVSIIMGIAYFVLSSFKSSNKKNDKANEKAYPLPPRIVAMFSAKELVAYRRAFRFCDTDFGGSISRDELASVVREFDRDADEATVQMQVDEFFNESDSNRG